MRKGKQQRQRVASSLISLRKERNAALALYIVFGERHFATKFPLFPLKQQAKSNHRGLSKEQGVYIESHGQGVSNGTMKVHAVQTYS